MTGHWQQSLFFPTGQAIFQSYEPTRKTVDRDAKLPSLLTAAGLDSIASRQSSEIRQDCACMLASWNHLASRASLDRPTSYIGINYPAYQTGPTAPHTGSAAPGRRPVTQIFGGGLAQVATRGRRPGEQKVDRWKWKGDLNGKSANPCWNYQQPPRKNLLLACPEWAEGAVHSLRLRKWLAAWRYLDFGVPPPKAVTSKMVRFFVLRGLQRV
jgi:hypothetical protein